MKSIRSFVFFILVFFSSSLDQTTQCDEKIPIEITIFIHGAISTSWKALLLYFFSFWRDDISGTVYEKIVPKIRNDVFFYQNHAMQGLGLVALDINEVKKGDAAAGLALLFNSILSDLHKKEKIRRYYTYGWQGHFTKKARKKEAETLYVTLLDLYQTVISEGFEPKFRLIGYCHGAQMITELADIHRKYDKNNETMRLILDEIILLAMPVSPDTASLLTSPLFKKIYHIFSSKDRIQKIDLFVTKTLIASREIPVRENNKKLTEKLIQIELKIKTYIREKMKKINFNKTKHVLGHKRHWKNTSPGHIELWFFGWTPDNYRTDLIFYPLPGLTFIPYIIHLIEQEESFFDPCSRIIADIRPDFNTVLLRQDIDKKKWRLKVKELFTKSTTLELLKDLAHSFAPHQYQTLSEYRKRIAQHYKSL